MKELVRKGESVVVLDNNYRGLETNLSEVKNQITLIEGDIRNPEVTAKSLKDIETVFHLAFINGTENFYSDPDLVIEVGLKGTLNILDSMKNSNVKNFIYASSSEVYQTPLIVPTNENELCKVPDVKNARYSYGSSKLMGEIMTLHYLKKYNLNKKIFRPHNIYGPNMGWGHVVPQIMKKIAQASNYFSNTEATIEIQGTGKETRSFCYIDDAVQGIILIAKNGIDGEIYNIGSDKEISIGNFIMNIGNILGIKLNLNYGKIRLGGTERRCPDIKKISNIGFKNIYNLSEGLETTINWYRDKLLMEK